MTEAQPDDAESVTEAPTESASLQASMEPVGSVGVAATSSSPEDVDERLQRLMTYLPLVLGPMAFAIVVTTSDDRLYAWISLALFWAAAPLTWKLFRRQSPGRVG